MKAEYASNLPFNYLKTDYVHLILICFVDFFVLAVLAACKDSLGLSPNVG